MMMPSPSHWARLFGGQSAARPTLESPPFPRPSRRCRQFRNQDSSPQHTAPHLPSRCAERERAAFLRCHWGPLRFLAASLAAIAPWQEICAILMPARGCPCQRSHALIGWQGTVPETLTVGLVSASLFLRQEGLARADLGAGPYLRRGG